jgi:hypothetical protein
MMMLSLMSTLLFVNDDINDVNNVDDVDDVNNVNNVNYANVNADDERRKKIVDRRKKRITSRH